jgi:hypothetical protein
MKSPIVKHALGTTFIPYPNRGVCNQDGQEICNLVSGVVRINSATRLIKLEYAVKALR